MEQDETGGQSLPQNIEEYFRQYGVPEQYASAYDNKVLALESIEKEDASSSVQPTLAADQAAQGEHPSASFYITVADLMGLVNGEARRYLPKNAGNSNTSAENIPLSGYMQYGKAHRAEAERWELFEA